MPHPESHKKLIGSVRSIEQQLLAFEKQAVASGLTHHEAAFSVLCAAVARYMANEPGTTASEAIFKALRPRRSLH